MKFNSLNIYLRNVILRIDDAINSLNVNVSDT